MPAHKGYIRATPHGPDRPDDWRDRAECKDDPTPDLWFVHPRSDRHGIAAAKAICRRCPVAAECLAEALADPNIVGVWGGLDEQQRARLHKERKAPTGPKEIKHGTPGGARTHRKRGEEPCGVHGCREGFERPLPAAQDRETTHRKGKRMTHRRPHGDHHRPG
jgi:WhiB family redox-sensing transcriptional regulator